MKPTIVDDKEFPYLLINNFFSNEEYDLIWREVMYLFNNNHFHDCSLDKNSAHTDGKPLASNSRCYPNDVLNESQRQNSGLYNSIRKIQNKEFHKLVEQTFKNSPYALYKTFLGTNRSSLLLKYYGEAAEYKEHFDQPQFSMITWLYKEPKNFEGGDFILTKNNTRVKCSNNTCIIFPGFYYHKVEPIKIIDKTIKDGGRFSINRFFYTIYD